MGRFYSFSMRNTPTKAIDWVKNHPLLAGIGFVLLAPSFVFGFVFDILGFIGWGRIILALVIVGGWQGFKFAKSYLDDQNYLSTADEERGHGPRSEMDWYK